MLNDRANEPETIGHSPSFLDYASEPFGCAPVEGLAGVDEVVEGANCFLNGRVAIGAVGVQNVDVGELQTLQGGFCGFNQVLAGEAEVVDFVAGGGKGGVVGSPIYLAEY